MTECAMHPRRDFLRKTLFLTIPAVAAGLPLGLVRAAGAVTSNPYAPPVRARGTTVRNVRDYGARGNGTTDDTNAIQNAINSLPSTGGTVDIPAGTYLIDAVKGINLRSRMHLRLASGAVLRAKTNSADWYNVLLVKSVTDVEVSGGQIEGDLDRHIGSTGQWGHGIWVRGSARVTIRDMLLRKCWGDGICVGSVGNTLPSDVVVANVICSANRRQGMSIGQCNNVRVYDSEFSHTVGIPTGCGIGIDIEPTPTVPGWATNVLIQNCNLHHNKGNGIQVYKLVRGTTIRSCTVMNNGGYGILGIGAKTAVLRDNLVDSNGLNGIAVRSGCDAFQVYGNVFYNNSLRLRGRTLAKVATYTRVGQWNERHTQKVTSTNITIGSNSYQDR
jgi:polygalacturonase